MLRLRRGWAAGVLVALSVLVAAPAGAADVREDQSWVLKAMNVERAWQVTRGAGVTVALVDGRVDDDVAELRGRVVSGPVMGSETSADGLTEAGHGTAMASLIAGAGKGDGGLLGIAPEARILSLPVILLPRDGDPTTLPEKDQRTGADSPLARAIRYATDHGAKVVSMSLGAYGPHRAEREAVSYALSRGVVLVAAVGNDGGSDYALDNATSFWNFPAGYSGVIGVGAVDSRGRPAPFSSDNLSVLVSAPGVGVPVVTPGGDHGTSEGTSAATALVAGVAALIKAKYPDISPSLVSQALTSTAGSAPGAGYDDHVGFGVVDAGAALTRAGELIGRTTEAPSPVGKHFGAGSQPQEPARPGPDPFRLWLYGAGLFGGLLAFTGAVVLLSRRPQHAVPAPERRMARWPGPRR
ncbi:S8 family serine peptidase [Streptosporangium sp. NBC_01756]|uniref:S8 family serine peptidase n=1 Tax=Streptosporangium sp. NBC_01756 TaxID=2975950 RepID=UPI002DDA193E|nr:S8 family serine peptidase [Streptosporangium sp. NBC_01756]WSC89171.1 S8 family serine peptidase [Streptosporangium sp. NBC_01756]